MTRSLFKLLVKYGKIMGEIITEEYRNIPVKAFVNKQKELNCVN
jgi:hypothetical protein